MAGEARNRWPESLAGIVGRNRWKESLEGTALSPFGRGGDRVAVGEGHGKQLRGTAAHHCSLLCWHKVLSTLSPSNPDVLSQFQPLDFNPVAGDLCKVVLRLLHEPAFFGAAKNLG